MNTKSDTSKNDVKLYNKNIRTAKILIPVIAIVLTVITILFTLDGPNSVSVQNTQQAIEFIRKNELIDPIFESVDEKDQPFTITAEKAIRGDTDEDVIFLTNPSGDITLQNSRWLSAKAQNGSYNQARNRLALKDNVSIFDNEGYTLQTSDMTVDLNENTLISASKVYAQGPPGLLESNGMFANLETGLLSFKGPAKLTLQGTGSDLGDLQ